MDNEVTEFRVIDKRGDEVIVTQLGRDRYCGYWMIGNRKIYGTLDQIMTEIKGGMNDVEL